MLEKTLESPLDCKEIQPVHSEGDQPWDFFGRTDAKAEAPILWPPDAKSWFIGKDSDAGRDWGQEEKGMPEDEMAGWHHWLDGQGGLACCNSWSRKESDTTERLNWTEARWQYTTLMYSLPNLELVCFVMSSQFCSFLTCIQVSQEAGKVFPSLSEFSMVCCNPHKGFSIVNKTEVDVFSGILLLFFMIQQMLAIWSLVCLPFLNPAYTSGGSWFTYCWNLAWRILSITLLACDMSVTEQ